MWKTFDIETGPLPDDELLAICPPFEKTVPTECPPFDPATVKTGNLKDEAKINEKIEAARRAHFRDFKNAAEDIARERDSHFANFKDRAALCPTTGRVLLIAIFDVLSQDESFLLNDDESSLLFSWWEVVKAAKKSKERLAGVNIFNFDLPFLVRRSWILGVPVPNFVFDLSSKWVNPDPLFFDLRAAWQLGNRTALSSFDLIGKALKTGGKSAGDHGKHFAELFASDRATALDYAANDVRQPAAWLYKMGLTNIATPIPSTVPATAPITTPETPEVINDSAFDAI